MSDAILSTHSERNGSAAKSPAAEAATPIRVLLVEDSDRDAALIALTLRRGGYAPQVTRVETREQMVAAFENDPFDVVLCDYVLPRFTAAEALHVVLGSGRDIPFIVVSGVIGEETAVDLMRAGATDYLLKDRLARLPAAIGREVEQASVRRAKRAVETLFRALLRGSPDPTVVVTRDTFVVVEASHSFTRQFLGDATLPPGRPLFSVVDFSHEDRIRQLIARGSGTAWYAVYYRDSSARVANVRCHTVEHEGASYAYVVLEDVTEQHYLKAAFDAIPDAVLVISSEDRLLYANRMSEELFGSLVFGMEVAPMLARPHLESQWWRTPTPRFDERRLEIGGQPFEAISMTFRFAGEPDVSTILTLHNVSEEEELLQLATHDALTGVYNVRFFASALEEQIAGAGAGTPVALALIDLDHFKPINDELGHAAGDVALITFANVVRNELRASDVFARLGGDEFAVIFPHRTPAEAVAVMERIYARLARTPLRFDRTTRPLTTSCGIGDLRTHDTPESARRRADRALYAAKRNGRNCWVVAGPDSE